MSERQKLHFGLGSNVYLYVLSGTDSEWREMDAEAVVCSSTRELGYYNLKENKKEALCQFSVVKTQLFHSLLDMKNYLCFAAWCL